MFLLFIVWWIFCALSLALLDLRWTNAMRRFDLQAFGWSVWIVGSLPGGRLVEFDLMLCIWMGCVWWLNNINIKKIKHTQKSFVFFVYWRTVSRCVFVVGGLATPPLNVMHFELQVDGYLCQSRWRPWIGCPWICFDLEMHVDDKLWKDSIIVITR